MVKYLQNSNDVGIQLVVLSDMQESFNIVDYIPGEYKTTFDITREELLMTDNTLTRDMDITYEKYKNTNNVIFCVFMSSDTKLDIIKSSMTNWKNINERRDIKQFLITLNINMLDTFMQITNLY